MPSSVPYRAMSLPCTSMPTTSSAGTSSTDAASIHVTVVIGGCLRKLGGSDGIDDRVGDHLAVEHAKTCRELQSVRGRNHRVDVAANVEHRRGLVELGAEHRVVGLAVDRA